MRTEVKIGLGIGLVLVCVASLYFFAKPPSGPPGAHGGGGRDDATELAGPLPELSALAGADRAREPLESAEPVAVIGSRAPAQEGSIGLSLPLPSELVLEDLAPDEPDDSAERGPLPVASLPPPPPATKAPLPVPKASEAVTHTVQPGDSFYTIARDHYGDPGKHKLIAKANPKLNPRKLKIGAKLVLPPLSEQPTASTRRPRELANAYQVRPGDTLVEIARELFGSQKNFRDIYKVNLTRLPEGPDRLKVGQVLHLPDLPRVDGGR